jgi:hypothetical protein
MEEAQGTQLAEVWDSMKISDKTNIVKGLVEIEKKLLSVSFTRFVFRGGEIVSMNVTNLIPGTAIFTSQAMHFQDVKQLRLWAIFLQN